MNATKALKTIKECRQYLMAGNPIWDIKDIDEAFTIAIDAMKKLSEKPYCEDCMWCEKVEIDNKGVIDTKYWCEVDTFPVTVSPDDYCSKGARESEDK